MEFMFSEAISFNQPLAGWDTSEVVSMENMFCGATQFNQSLMDWDISSLENIEGMFLGASSVDPAQGERFRQVLYDNALLLDQ